jgi:hypothetical protein
MPVIIKWIYLGQLGSISISSLSTDLKSKLYMIHVGTRHSVYIDFKKRNLANSPLPIVLAIGSKPHF